MICWLECILITQCMHKDQISARMLYLKYYFTFSLVWYFIVFSSCDVMKEKKNVSTGKIERTSQISSGKWNRAQFPIPLVHYCIRIISFLGKFPEAKERMTIQRLIWLKTIKCWKIMKPKRNKFTYEKR